MILEKENVLTIPICSEAFAFQTRRLVSSLPEITYEASPLNFTQNTLPNANKQNFNCWREKRKCDFFMFINENQTFACVLYDKFPYCGHRCMKIFSPVSTNREF